MYRYDAKKRKEKEIDETVERKQREKETKERRRTNVCAAIVSVCQLLKHSTSTTTVKSAKLMGTDVYSLA